MVHTEHIPTRAKTDAENNEITLEQYEWTNLWWDQPAANGDRVLLIGDSITYGYQSTVRELMPQDIYIDMYSTSRALDNPCFFKELSYMLSQAAYKVIHFNNGLHGEHISAADFQNYYENAVEMLLNLPYKPELILAGTTPIADPDEPQKYHECNAKSIERNQIAAQVAEKYHLQYENLYSVVDGVKNIRKPDPYHYNKKGCLMLADVVVQNMKNKLRR